MYDETITINVDALREKLKSECLGAFFGGGFGGALLECCDIARGSTEEVVEYAIRNRINLEKFTID